MAKLILMRHGQSEWNRSNLFTGWVDIPLSAAGVEEAIAGGRRIQNEAIDVIFTSTLIRAQMTAALAMMGHSSGKVPRIIHAGEGQIETWEHVHSAFALEQTIPVFLAWQLNERMYGQLQGMNKQELAERYGKEQVQIWRRSFDVAPPGGESLKMTAERTIPYFEKSILPWIQKGKSVFVSAHGNSLRSILMHLDSLSPDCVTHLEVPTGLPILYAYSNGQLIRQQQP